MHVHKYR